MITCVILDQIEYLFRDAKNFAVLEDCQQGVKTGCIFL
jgi:hypothetical protein